MKLSEYENYDAAIAQVRKATSARMRELATLEAYVEGTQYADRPDWFSAECPLWERAPCIVYPIAKTAIDSNVDLVLGAKTFPTIAVPVSEDDGEDGLSQDEAEIVNKWLCELEHYVRLRPISRELFASGQACSSACAIVALRGGRPVIDTVNAGWCTPTLDVDGAVTSLVIEYPYLQQSKQPDGRWRVDPMLYRRVIDGDKDVTYLPAKLDDTEPEWKPKTEVKHGLGFCPVVWYPHAKGCSTVADVDGKAVHGNLLDEITALDFTLSQRHRAAMYAGDPQWTETGVEPGSNPSSGGRVSMVAPATPLGGTPSASNPITGSYAYVPRANVRKKSPGDIWQYENENAKITLHTLPGDALTSLDSHAKDLKSKICEALGVSFLDPENIPRGGELSSTTVKTLRARQLDRCDTYRADFGDLCLRPIVSMLVRIVLARPNLKLPGLKKVLPLLARVQERGLLLRLNWGPYSRPDPAEELALVQAATLALEKGIATVRSAVLMTKDVLCVEDIEEHVKQLAQEAEERRAKVMEDAEHAASLKSQPESKSQDAA